MIFESDISISVWANPYLSAFVVRELHPKEDSNEDKYNPLKNYSFSPLMFLLLFYS